MFAEPLDRGLELRSLQWSSSALPLSQGGCGSVLFLTQGVLHSGLKWITKGDAELLIFYLSSAAVTGTCHGIWFMWY